jgi:hypothetical protein
VERGMKGRDVQSKLLGCGIGLTLEPFNKLF